MHIAWVWLFDPGRVGLASLSEPVGRYIEHGEALGLPARYKCRVRKPWYAPPRCPVAPLWLARRQGHVPRLIRNQVGAVVTDHFYRVEVEAGVDADALAACYTNAMCNFVPVA